jgi:subtilisin family serine protease
MRRRLSIIAIAGLLAGVVSASDYASARRDPGQTPASGSTVDLGRLRMPGGKHAKLSSSLVFGATRTTRLPSARTDTRVRVEIEARTGRDRAVKRLVIRHEGTVEGAYRSLIQALVRPSTLLRIANDPAVRFVREPTIYRPFAVNGEAAAASGASAWHASGITGAGVLVGIIDSGFAGLARAQATGDIGTDARVVDLCGGEVASTDHGTGVAEVVQDVAPRAQLVLICANTTAAIGYAVDYARNSGVRIINHSRGSYVAGRGDGTGPWIQQIVANARASDILWVNASGNAGLAHWSGRFVDADRDRWHNFTRRDETNEVIVLGGKTFCAELKWDSWPYSSQDFDLALLASVRGKPVAVAVSNVAQRGRQVPVEGACVKNTSASPQRLGVGIWRARATASPRFDLYASEGAAQLEHAVPSGSLSEPATSPHALAVGAACWQTQALEAYSSQGPTIDKRVKPDLAGYDSVSSTTYGPFVGCGRSGFTGTSAAAPAVAGAAALVRQSNPSWTAVQLQAYLEQHAADLGAPGKDSLFGSGGLRLPPPP